jgi:5-methyltetrahydropteroyltriglutamate--homocysteine methyltransferase
MAANTEGSPARVPADRIRAGFKDRRLLTAVVGSYPQPGWLVDRDQLLAEIPRVPRPEFWRVPDPDLGEAQDDATRIAIRDLEDAGLDIIGDGEIRRESYTNRFQAALSGIDCERPAMFREFTGDRELETPVPRVVGPVLRRGPVEAGDAAFLRAHTGRATKVTLPGPLSLAEVACDEYYHDQRALALAFARALNAEIKDLFAAGIDIVQLDEPFFQDRPAAVEQYGIDAVNEAIDGVGGAIALHMCFGYAHFAPGKPRPGYPFLDQLAGVRADVLSFEAAQASLDLGFLNNFPRHTIMLGVLDLSTDEVESPALIADRIRAAIKFVDPERLIVSPDCGMKFLSRRCAFRKLRALALAADLVRSELA